MSKAIQMQTIEIHRTAPSGGSVDYFTTIALLDDGRIFARSVHVPSMKFEWYEVTQDAPWLADTP